MQLSLVRIARFTAVVVAAVIYPAWSSAASFSADVIAKSGSQVFKGKIYVKGNKSRQEGPGPSSGRTTIVRADKGVTWFVDPASKSYVEIHSARICPFPTDAELRNISTRKSAGTKTINGYPCRGTVYTPKAKDPNLATLTTWYSDKLQWPVKSEYKTKARSYSVEYTNIKVNVPADSLFEVPKGYKKKLFQRGGNLPTEQKGRSAAPRAKKK